jgi:GNAT superfamily N-acetyltransferase
MSMRLRFLLDTNVLIPLQDSYQILERNLANFVRLAGLGGHQLLFHAATVADFERDRDKERKRRNLERLAQYSMLDRTPPCPWNNTDTSPNDVCDNEILYALECDAIHVLVTEDRGIHAKARSIGLGDRVYTIQTAEDWLRRLHEPRQVELPNIDDVPLHSLTPDLHLPFFDSLRDGYGGVEFDRWFRDKARENRRTWVYRDEGRELAAMCIYAVQHDQEVTESGVRLAGAALKLCTFKVGETVRGRKIGELFLKASFRYATENACEHIFIHANADRHDYLIQLLRDFGFGDRGAYKGDTVLIKGHPKSPPDMPTLSASEYNRQFFPHFRRDRSVRKFLIPIQPPFHETLFPDYHSDQRRLFTPSSSVGNAIKLAYLCHAQTNAISAGDVVLFYRTIDEKAVTSAGVVDRFEVLEDPAKIASLVSRRTVYSQQQIVEMTKRRTKVILFRLVEHFPQPVSYARLQQAGIVGPIQSIRELQDDAFSRVLAAAGR